MDVDELLVSQPDTGEQALEITETLIRSGGIDCVVVDSVAALVPRAEIEGEMGDSFMGIQARLMSQALRKLTGIVSRSNYALVFTNQLREKIGVMFGNPGDHPRRTGPQVLRQRPPRHPPHRDHQVRLGGHRHPGCASRSSRTRSPRRSASPSSTSCTATGISREGGLLDVGVASDVVTKTGAWFTYGETRLGQGREQSKEFLRANPDVAAAARGGDPRRVATIDVPVEGISEAE